MMQEKEESKEVMFAAQKALETMEKNPGEAQRVLFTEAAKLLPEDLPRGQQQEYVQIIAKRIAQKAAEMQTQKKLPVDFRQGANPASAVKRAQVAGAMGVRPPAPQTVQRSIINDETLAAFGFPVQQRNYGDLLQQDMQQRMDPMLFKSQLR